MWSEWSECSQSCSWQANRENYFNGGYYYNYPSPIYSYGAGNTYARYPRSPRSYEMELPGYGQTDFSATKAEFLVIPVSTRIGVIAYTRVVRDPSDQDPPNRVPKF